MLIRESCFGDCGTRALASCFGYGAPQAMVLGHGGDRVQNGEDGGARQLQALCRAMALCRRQGR